MSYLFRKWIPSNPGYRGVGDWEKWKVVVHSGENGKWLCTLGKTESGCALRGKRKVVVRSGENGKWLCTLGKMESDCSLSQKRKPHWRPQRSFERKKKPEPAQGGGCKKRVGKISMSTNVQPSPDAFGYDGTSQRGPIIPVDEAARAFWANPSGEIPAWEKHPREPGVVERIRQVAMQHHFTEYLRQLYSWIREDEFDRIAASMRCLIRQGETEAPLMLAKCTVQNIHEVAKSEENHELLPEHNIIGLLNSKGSAAYGDGSARFGEGSYYEARAETANGNRISGAVRNFSSK